MVGNEHLFYKFVKNQETFSFFFSFFKDEHAGIDLKEK